MSGTHIDLKFSAVVEKYENQPPWLIALCELTGESCDSLVKTMLETEMHDAGHKFIAKFPELFRGGLA